MRKPIEMLNLKIKVFVTLSKIQKRLKNFSSAVCLQYYGGESFTITDTIPMSFDGYIAIANITNNTKPSDLYDIVTQLVEQVVLEYHGVKSDRFSVNIQAS
ncbi:MAG: hypothetical protein MUD14_12495 [Hydrococcus sp. Prado102]|jgi:hypothetical protein|nr:hypothetical protein [Hydrococcus sp. Prado102]